MSLKAKKSLGQHFLRSNTVLKKIIEVADMKRGDVVLEIGPGEGVLTRELLKSGANVVAVEKDIRAFEWLKNIEWGHTFKVIYGDILDNENFGQEFLNSLGDRYSIVANIPYYITGAILEKFLEYEPRPWKMVLLVQKEVAERIVAKDGKESILSISVKAFGMPKIVAKVPRGAFVPVPKVDSAILLIDNIGDEHFRRGNVSIKKFFEIVKAGFAHKRKFLSNNLEKVLGKERVVEIWQKLDLHGTVRAEDLHLEHWLELARLST